MPVVILLQFIHIFQQKLFALYDVVEQNRMFLILWLLVIYQSTIFTSAHAIQLINVALARPAYQIDYNSSCNCTAHKAVDGRVDAVNHGCAQTATSTGWMWWIVDLALLRHIRIVQLYNRLDEYRK